MKVYLAACGEGWGHTSRVLGLAAGLVREGHSVTIGCYGSGLRRLQKFREEHSDYDYKTTRVVPEVVIKGESGKFDLGKSVLASLYQFPHSVGSVFRERRYIKENAFDVVVSDSRAATMLAGIFAGKPTIYVGNVTTFIVDEWDEIDSGGSSRDENENGTKFKKFKERIKKKSERLGYYLIEPLTSHFYAYPDAIAIADFAPPNTLCAPLLSKKRKIKRLTHFVGPLSVLCVERPKPARWDAKGKTKLLVSLGGLAIKEGFHKKILEILRKKENIDVVYPSLFFKKEKKIGNVRVVPQLPSIFHYIAAADMCIIPGGHASPMETIILQKPSIAIPAKSMSEQISNAKMYEKLGLGKCIMAEEIGQLPQAIDEIIDDYDKYKRRHAELSKRAMGEENGVQNTKKLIESFVKFY